MRSLSIVFVISCIFACNDAEKKDTVTKDTELKDTITNEPKIPPAQTSDTVFTAFGNEPFWAVYVIKDKKILFHPADGADVEVPYVTPSAGTAASTVYQSSGNGNSLSLTITKKDCSDGMSDQTHAYESILLLNKVSYRGCGRE